MVRCMNDVLMADTAPLQVENVLRDELAQGDVALATARPILRHLLAHDDHALFNDEVIARVRGMVHDVAHQLLFATADAAGLRDRTALIEELSTPLAQALFQDTEVLAHAHAITLETQIVERLQRRNGIDAVLSPLVQEQAASTDPMLAGLAMTIIASQARHMQRFRRMELPLGELPGELFHRALLALRSVAVDHEPAAEQAERALRQSFVEADGRLALMGRMAAAIGGREPRLLALDHAGLPLFTTSLAMASQQSRVNTVLALCEGQYARLALAARAAGMVQTDVVTLFRFLHPDISLPDGFELLRADRAAALLADPTRPFALTDLD